jgi:hypothetical protein
MGRVADEFGVIFRVSRISIPGPDMVKAKPGMNHHHRDSGSDSEFDDPSEWSRASYNHHPCDDFEPLPDICRMGRLLCQRVAKRF